MNLILITPLHLMDLIWLLFNSIARASFETVGKWIHEAKTHRGDDVKIVICGNKLDDEENR